MIYADNAATTKMSKAAIDAMLPYMEEYYGNPSSLYAFGQQAKEALENAGAGSRPPPCRSAGGHVYLRRQRGG